MLPLVFRFVIPFEFYQHPPDLNSVENFHDLLDHKFLISGVVLMYTIISVYEHVSVWLESSLTEVALMFEGRLRCCCCFRHWCSSSCRRAGRRSWASKLPYNISVSCFAASAKVVSRIVNTCVSRSSMSPSSAYPRTLILKNSPHTTPSPLPDQFIQLQDEQYRRYNISLDKQPHASHWTCQSKLCSHWCHSLWPSHLSLCISHEISRGSDAKPALASAESKCLCDIESKETLKSIKVTTKLLLFFILIINYPQEQHIIATASLLPESGLPVAEKARTYFYQSLQ